jgi:hypothetical protein
MLAAGAMVLLRILMASTIGWRASWRREAEELA